MFSKEKFCERLISARKESGMTQGQLGEALGTKKQAVNNWENGRNFPPLDVAANLAETLNISLDYLVGQSDTPGRK